MLIQLGVQVLVGCTKKQQTRSISLTTGPGTREHLAQQLYFDLLCLATERLNEQKSNCKGAYLLVF